MALPTIMAVILVASNNVLLSLLFCLLDRSGLDIPKWVLDNGTVIRIMAVDDGYEVTMIHPVPVSNEARFVSKATFDGWLAGSGHGHLNLSKGHVFYLVRHGHAGHNDPKASLQEAWDADLTPLGRTQALASGKAIFADAMTLGVTKLFACCSPLVRTAQTVYDILQQFPPQMRPNVCLVLIEAIEHIRLIGLEHHWRMEDALLSVAKDPFLTLDELRPLFPEGTSPDVIKRAQIENLPRTNPEIKSEANLMKLGELKLDWSVYIAKVKEARQNKKSFGNAASDKYLLDVLLSIVQAQ
jgi:bisphosphoglycerate-dependent phosphoglycerate mutase